MPISTQYGRAGDCCQMARAVSRTTVQSLLASTPQRCSACLHVSMKAASAPGSSTIRVSSKSKMIACTMPFNVVTWRNHLITESYSSLSTKARQAKFPPALPYLVTSAKSYYWHGHNNGGCFWFCFAARSGEHVQNPGLFVDSLMP